MVARENQAVRDIVFHPYNSFAAIDPFESSLFLAARDTDLATGDEATTILITDPILLITVPIVARITKSRSIPTTVIAHGSTALILETGNPVFVFTGPHPKILMSITLPLDIITLHYADLPLGTRWRPIAVDGFVDRPAAGEEQQRPYS